MGPAELPTPAHHEPKPKGPQGATSAAKGSGKAGQGKGQLTEDKYVEMAAFIVLLGRGLPQTEATKRYLDERVELYLESQGVTRQQLDGYVAKLTLEEKKRLQQRVHHKLFEMAKIEVKPTGLGRPIAPDANPLEPGADKASQK